MKRTKISELLNQGQVGQQVNVKGWVRTFRSNRFVAVNDGSTINNLQAVVDFENFDEALLKRITTGACVSINGELVESQGKGQSVEVVLYLPVGHSVNFDTSLEDYLYDVDNVVNMYDDEMLGRKWIMMPEGLTEVKAY